MLLFPILLTITLALTLALTHPYSPSSYLHRPVRHQLQLRLFLLLPLSRRVFQRRGHGSVSAVSRRLHVAAGRIGVQGVQRGHSEQRDGRPLHPLPRRHVLLPGQLRVHRLLRGRPMVAELVLRRRRPLLLRAARQLPVYRKTVVRVRDRYRRGTNKPVCPPTAVLQQYQFLQITLVTAFDGTVASA